MTGPALALILFAGLLACASPGPATLSIAGMSMSSGRSRGLALASGVTTGSFIWSVSAALGLSAIMASHVWIMETMRYVGAVYLGYLAWKSARSAWCGGDVPLLEIQAETLKAAYFKGLALHLTNPKAVLFFGALYSIGIPQGTTMQGLFVVIISLGLMSAAIFHGYALLFSTRAIQRGYARLRRPFDAAFALFFGVAAIKIFAGRAA